MASDKIQKLIDIDVRQIQVNFPSAITITKGAYTNLFVNENLKNKQSAIDPIPSDKTLIAAIPTWVNSAATAGVTYDTYVHDGLINVGASCANANSVSVSAIRLVTFWI